MMDAGELAGSCILKWSGCGEVQAQEMTECGPVQRPDKLWHVQGVKSTLQDLGIMQNVKSQRLRDGGWGSDHLKHLCHAKVFGFFPIVKKEKSPNILNTGFSHLQGHFGKSFWNDRQKLKQGHQLGKF